jgi:carbonic anhydrase
MHKLLAGYKSFREHYFAEHREMLQRLMAGAQAPRALMIACSDSRIDPALKFGADPGDLFMVRNVANLVPPYHPDGDFHGTSAALEFGVKVLRVKNIIVMGHAKCGGIGALIRHEEAEATDFVAAWMKMVAAARDRALAVAGPDAPEDEIQRLVEQEAVKDSLANLMTFPWVKERVMAGETKLHGWYFDLATGTLHVMDSHGIFKPADA